MPRVPGRIPLAVCNLCGFPVVRLHRGDAGQRCVRCLSTFRHRAIGRVLDDQPIPSDAAVYELSSRGALHRYLVRRFSDVTASEYFDDVPPGSHKGGVQCQDVEHLTYPDRSFDVVTSTEVFEHVADDAQGFREVLRVLRPGGHFVFTVPLTEEPDTIERAVRRNGDIVHLLEPEFHGDRLRGQGAVLAFRTYGRDIVERLAAAGFVASIARIASARNAICHGRVVVGRRPA